jgi:hypothetical protein
VADGMTLVDIDTPQEVRRDQYGRYKVVPPEGGKPVGYQRATTLAKMLEDTSNLTSWACRMTLLGAAQRPDIIASTLAANADDRQVLNKLAEQAKEHGGANIRRDLGTAIHRFVELSHANPDYTVPEPYAADVKAINAAIDAAGFDVIVDYSERILVVDGIQVAGMCDLGLRHRTTGLLHVGDLKTGSSVKYGALGWATQLSIYSMANNIYEQGAAKDGSEDRRLPAPDFDRGQAFIIHCEPQSGHADVYQLAIGERFVDLAVAVREVRKVKDLLVKFEGGGASTTTGTTAGTANAGVVVGSVEDNQSSDAAAPVTSPAGPVSSPAGDASTSNASPMAGEIPEIGRNAEGQGAGGDLPPAPAGAAAIVHEAAVAWIINRTDAVIDALSKQHVGAAWPTDVARPLAIKNGDAAWTDADLTAIANALDALERKHALELPLSADPRTLARKRQAAEAKAVKAATPPPKLTPAPDDDGPAPDHYVLELKRLAGQMQQSPAPAIRERIARAQLWQNDANRADVPWRTGLGPNGQTPMRVWAIGRAAIAATALVDFTADDPDHAVRRLLETQIGLIAMDLNHRVGSLLGALSADQAIALWDIADETTNTTTIAKDNNNHGH